MIFDDTPPPPGPNLGKIWFSMTPRPKLGKIWNVDYFDIVAPPLTLAKTIPKSYQTDTWGLFYSYKGHICTKCCIYLTNTSPIYHKNQGHISVIWIWEKSEKFRPPPSVKVSLHLKCRLFWFYGLFPQLARAVGVPVGRLATTLVPTKNIIIFFSFFPFFSVATFSSASWRERPKT